MNYREQRQMRRQVRIWDTKAERHVPAVSVNDLLLSRWVDVMRLKAAAHACVEDIPEWQSVPHAAVSPTQEPHDSAGP